MSWFDFFFLNFLSRTIPPRLNLAANLRISYLRNKYRDAEDDDDDDVIDNGKDKEKRSKSRASQTDWGIKTNSAWKILKTK